ncbi:potassium channel family protein [Marinobacterium marinum]|uniref:Two pore domain potassium channel family protein n=1 Tax=Marinobacterium marinum TaxID=2756129 RepID=A0A7W2AD14_9GAMM|nr:potassium channel family protein [Marinobacterium marinum]MBA4502708.1 two pore domain potassium channel family protein [Marinobacterium marinum]
MEYTFTFLANFSNGLALISPLILFLLMVIAGLATLVGKLEQWSLLDALYWGFITALTVGYGDMKPTRKPAKLLAILIAMHGIIMTGIIGALSVEATIRAFGNHFPHA